MTMLIYIAISLLALALIFGVMRGNTRKVNGLDDLETRLKSVDLAAFLNLTDPEDLEFLRASLSRSEFRRVQRKRTIAALRYLSAVSHNAAVLLRMGELARHSQNIRTRQAGQELIDTALQTRMFVAVLYLRMVSDLVRPSGMVQAQRLLEGYEDMKERLVHLVSIEQPMMTSRAATML